MTKIIEVEDCKHCPYFIIDTYGDFLCELSQRTINEFEFNKIADHCELKDKENA